MGFMDENHGVGRTVFLLETLGENPPQSQLLEAVHTPGPVALSSLLKAGNTESSNFSDAASLITLPVTQSRALVIISG